MKIIAMGSSMTDPDGAILHLERGDFIEVNREYMDKHQPKVGKDYQMNVKKYRKKPIEFEAIQLTRDAFNECCEFIGNDVCDASEDECNITIATLEGDMEARLNDFIIKGTKGEFYPCKPDIFPNICEEIV